MNHGQWLHGAARVLAALVGLSSLAGTVHAQAPSQAFPSRPIRVILGVTANGGPDIVARLVADKLTKSLGQPVLVENKVGAEHIIASEVVAKSVPDGHTLLLATSNHAVNPAVFNKLPYDTLKDFDPVALAYAVPLMLVVHPSLPAKTVQELVAYGKANPGKLSYATSGTGSLIAMAYFQSLAGLDMVHVPYKGSSAALPDLLSGRVELIIDNFTAVDPQAKSGKLRALAVTTTSRSTSAPAVPTIAGSGFPGYDISTWGGFVVPAGTPKDVVGLLNTAILKAVAAPDVRERMLGAGMEAGTGTPQQFGDFLRAEVPKWGKLARIAGIKPAD